ncbi:MAG TPA: M48 family metallopeptidase [Chryseolinea sp.]
MSALASFYPSTPLDVPETITQPSADFKKEVVRVMTSIFLFFIVYVILIILAIALAAASVYGGLMLIISVPKIITVMVGIGLMGLGILVFFFLVKFIFAVSKVDQSGNIEIKEEEQPELFAFIRQVTKDTQTPFPKKIFISPEVNACVFYNSSFWSMLFPVRKNLQIGLGLVNALNLSEFKAVMAHEFGHFSQRSMKLGSFVYNVNHVIYNMLYDNNSYGSLINKWANMSGYFAFFASITIRIVQGIQWVLQQMYGLINKSYMRLSRQMEFHADAVAASVSGSDNCINALRRIEVADVCYNTVISKYNEWAKQNVIGNNFYPSQDCVLKHLQKDGRVELDNHRLPIVKEEFFKTSNYSRVNFKDQWASHPAREDREAHLRKLNVHGETKHEPAWSIFRGAEQLQEHLTGKLYNAFTPGEKTVRIEPVQFEERFNEEVANYSLPEAYNGFYDSRELKEFDVESVAASAASRSFAKDEFYTIFTAENASLAKKIQHLDDDIETLIAIRDKRINIKSFDYDGQKYERQEADDIRSKLQLERDMLVQQQKELDENAFKFFYRPAKEKGLSEELKKEYADIFARRKEDKIFYDDCNALLELLGPIYQGEQLTMENVSYMVSQLKNDNEDKLKAHLRRFWKDGIFDSDAEFSALVKKFINSDYQYYTDDSLFTNEFSELHTLVFDASSLLSEDRFKKLKKVLEGQLRLVK